MSKENDLKQAIYNYWIKGKISNKEYRVNLNFIKLMKKLGRLNEL